MLNSIHKNTRLSITSTKMLRWPTPTRDIIATRHSSSLSTDKAVFNTHWEFIFLVKMVLPVSKFHYRSSAKTALIRSNTSITSLIRLWVHLPPQFPWKSPGNYFICNRLLVAVPTTFLVYGTEDCKQTGSMAWKSHNKVILF